MNKLFCFTYSVARHVCIVFNVWCSILRIRSGLIDCRRVEDGLFQSVPHTRFEGALFHFASRGVQVSKGICHALILSASVASAQVLTAEEIEGIRYTCKREPKLMPFVSATGVVACGDFELWLQLRSMGKLQDAELLIKPTKGN